MGIIIEYSMIFHVHHCVPSTPGLARGFWGCLVRRDGWAGPCSLNTRLPRRMTAINEGKGGLVYQQVVTCDNYKKWIYRLYSGYVHRYTWMVLIVYQHVSSICLWTTINHPSESKYHEEWCFTSLCRYSYRKISSCWRYMEGLGGGYSDYLRFIRMWSFLI